MTNQELKDKVFELLTHVDTLEKDTILSMIKPRFVDCDAEALTLTLAYPLMEWERNPMHILQGGIPATIFDYSMGCLAVAVNPTSPRPMTASLQVSYLRAAPIGNELIVKSKATMVGRTLIHATAEGWIASEPEKLVATAVTTYIAK